MQLKSLLALALSLFILAACSEAPVDVQPLADGAVVLVIGDSLVAGTGATAEQSWPSGLARRTGWSVVNAGEPGDTSEAALRRLPGLLETHLPDAVIIAVGGNDFLRNVPLANTRAQLEEMTRISKTAADHVAIMAVPKFSMAGAAFGALSDHDLFAGIAQSNGLVLIPRAIADTLSRAELRSDRIHANADGYARMAAHAHEVLTRHGWVAGGPAPRRAQ